MNNELIKIIIKLVGILIIAVGVIFIFDARKLAVKRFSFTDKNRGTKTLKIAGFVISIIGGIIAII